MRWKLIALTAFAVGYVFGARAGRERYEQIRRLAVRVKDDPLVQQKAHDAAESVKSHLPHHDGPDLDAGEVGPFHATTLP